MTQYELNLRDYWRVLKKRKNIVFLSTAMVGLFTFALSFSKQPDPVFESSASIKIEENKTLAGLYIDMMSMESGDFLETQALMITSFNIIELVSKNLGLIDEGLTSEEIRNNKPLLEIILDLKENVKTEREGSTSIINIIATSNDSEFAQRIANTTAEVFRDQNIAIKNKRISEARKFIENQLTIIGKKLVDAEEDILEHVKNTGRLSKDGGATVNISTLLKAEEHHRNLIKKEADTKTLITQLEEKNNISLDILRNFAPEDMSANFTKLANRIAERNIEKDLLLVDLTELHPTVKEVDAEIKEISKNLLLELRSKLLTITALIKTYKHKVIALNKKYMSLPKNELRLSRLERSVKVNEEVYAQLETKYQEVLIKEAEKVEDVSIIRPALESDMPINFMKKSNNVLVGLVLGLVLGLVIAFVYETMDTSIGSVDDVENLIEIPVIGMIPRVEKEEIKGTLEKSAGSNLTPKSIHKNALLVFHFRPTSHFAESFRSLRTNLQFISLEETLKVILFTSSSPNEGKTISALNFAITLAQSGKKVLLVDADLRKPAIHNTLGLHRGDGLSDIILGNITWQEAIKDVMDVIVGKIEMEDIMLVPGIDNLNIITAGSPSLNTTELILSKKMEEFIEEVKGEYDTVIFDSAPTLFVTDTVILGTKVDGVFLVYQTGEISRGALRRAKLQLENVKIKVYGVILNGMTANLSPDLYNITYGSQEYGSEEEKHYSFASGWSIQSLITKTKGLLRKKRHTSSQMVRAGILFAALSFLMLGFFNVR